MDLMGYDIIVDHRFVSENSGCDANQEQESLSYFLEMMDADDLHNEYCETMNGTQLNCVKAYAIGEGVRGSLTCAMRKFSLG